MPTTNSDPVASRPLQGRQLDIGAGKQGDPVAGGGEREVGRCDDRPQEVAGDQPDPEVEHGVRRSGVRAAEVDGQADQDRAEEWRRFEEPWGQPVEKGQEAQGRQVRRNCRHHQAGRVAIGGMGKREGDEQERRPDCEQVGERPGHSGRVLEHAHRLALLAPGDSIRQNAACHRGAILERSATHRSLCENEAHQAFIGSRAPGPEHFLGHAVTIAARRRS